MPHLGPYRERLNRVKRMLSEHSPPDIPADLPRIVRDLLPLVGTPNLSLLLQLTSDFPELTSWYAGERDRPCPHYFSRVQWQRRNKPNEEWRVYGAFLGGLLDRRLVEIEGQEKRDPVTLVIIDNRIGLIPGYTYECQRDNCFRLDPDTTPALAFESDFELRGRRDWNRFIEQNGFDDRFLNDLADPLHEAGEPVTFVERTAQKYD